MQNQDTHVQRPFDQVVQQMKRSVVPNVSHKLRVRFGFRISWYNYRNFKTQDSEWIWSKYTDTVDMLPKHYFTTHIPPSMKHEFCLDRFKRLVSWAPTGVSDCIFNYYDDKKHKL